MSSTEPADIIVLGSSIERSDAAGSDAEESKDGFKAGIPDIELYRVEISDGSEVERLRDANFDTGISDIYIYHIENSGAEGSDIEGSDVEGSDTGSSDYTSYMQTFELFPKLPIETCCMIWRASFLAPQRHVWSNLDTACCERIGLLCPPIALSICKESWTEALRCYERLDGGRQRCNHYECRTPYVFFNKGTDTLRTETTMSINGRLAEFCEDHFEKPCRDVLGQVRYLEIEEFAFDPHDAHFIPNGNLKNFRALKELTFIPVFWIWVEAALTGANAQAFITGYRDFSAKLAAEDPTRTIPKLLLLSLRWRPSANGTFRRR
jgi:2EXR family